MSATEITLGYAEDNVKLQLKKANRHGLIAGATGTGKTVTLQMLAEEFSQQGVPVFLADVKGDLSGVSQAGSPHPKITERFERMALPLDHWHGNPCVFWDVLGKSGHPIRATISDMGPLLLSRLLGLNDTQEGILNIAFSLADDEGMLLLDLKDLRSMLNHVADNAKELRSMYGNVSSASVGAIQRRLLVLERSGAEQFFGEPMLDFNDLLKTDGQGYGYINVLVANQLIHSAGVYSTFLLWLLSELFENLPEVGDPEKPVLVFFFDEAHLLFDGAPKALVDKIEQVVRLIRSKGVGIYFVTQSPSDIPDEVLAQLGNRIQHALRAFTPNEMKKVKAAANSFRSNDAFDSSDVIMELGVGEALVSTLDANGTPSVVARTMIKPPRSRIGPASSGEIELIRGQSPYIGGYDTALDRESAFEILAKRSEQAAAEAAADEQRKQHEETQVRTQKKPARRSNRQSAGEAFVKSMARTVGRQVGRNLIRGILGSLFKGR
ncbi:DUF853 family protein [Ketobacter sp. MCCC 1A13808]|uniref:helicase HerA-like domain-containing protein n=1 Tax=Ketobacter sp. MCCC 1A13808 TaxID=2602738 RepID=UPI0012EC45F5|nr:helicase HerA-like domain-containing protein [Ketobacter sp. MCCC 1A13808]MVF14573.1 DUF853 family protein [Ketobacter sp. MCCC 1A13808]